MFFLKQKRPIVQLIWEEFLKILKEESGSQVVETWFKSVHLEEWDSATHNALLRVPNQFVKNWIQDHYVTILQKHLGRLLHSDKVKVLFLCKEEKLASKTIIPASIAPLDVHTKSFLATEPYSIIQQPKSAYFSQPENSSNAIIPSKRGSLVTQEKKIKKKLNNSLNENYTFDNFVAGPSNSLAHAAAYAIKDNLGKIYNPLYIYGGTGLGKTHLLHAIGNELKKQNPNAIIHYETSDNFINEFINAIRFDRSENFRNKYHKVDLFLLDDIQFFSNKEQTQEMFFHVFNTLHEQQKQIVLSSDTFPQEIKGLQNRLKSRMEWGLVADIQMPDIETKIAILKKKAALNKVYLPDDVAEFISSRVLSNIRELEGALIRISAFASLTNNPISLEMAKKVLLNLQEKKQEGVMLETVMRITAKFFAVSAHDIKSKNRHKDIAVIRQVAFYLMKKLTFFSLQAIGSYVGGRDHSTVVHAVHKIEDLMQKDRSFNLKLKNLEQEIMSN